MLVRWPHTDILIALFFPGSAVWKPFLQITEDEIDRVANTHIKAAFGFSREAISAFQGQALDERVCSCRAQGFSALSPCQTQPPDRLDTQTLEQGREMDHTVLEKKTCCLVDMMIQGCASPVMNLTYSPLLFSHNFLRNRMHGLEEWRRW